MDEVDEYENAVDEAIDEVVFEVVHCLSEELQELLKSNRTCWVKDWVGRRSNLGASSTILTELANEDPQEYKKIMRMSVDQFNELLSLVEGDISKVDTVMRSAIPARVKLEIALRCLATGDSYQSLAIPARVKLEIALRCLATGDSYQSLAIPARVKLEIALRCLATGDSYQSLAIPARVKLEIALRCLATGDSYQSLAIPARVKLEIALRCLATGDSYQSLAIPARVKLEIALRCLATGDSYQSLAIPARVKLEIALRCLATGDSYQSLAIPARVKLEIALRCLATGDSYQSLAIPARVKLEIALRCLATGDSYQSLAIPARVKLEIALRFLATGDSYQSLAIPARVKLEIALRCLATGDSYQSLAIPARVKLEIALRCLATGDSYQSLAIFFRVPANTISSFMPDVLKAITTALKDYMKVPKTKDEWKEVQKNFETKWNFPSCVGAIDGKHVAIKRPPGSCSEFFNYLGGYSVILLALVDADYKFLFVDVGTNGRANDGSVFRLSSLKVAIDNKTLQFPEEHFIVGDDAFPLRENLMKPFSKKNLTLEERIFNYRLSRARRVVENAFGIMAARFRIFGREIEVDLETVDLIVLCTCTLHNWLRTTSPATYFERGWIDQEDTESGIFVPGLWRSTRTALPSLKTARSTNSHTKIASDTRMKLAHFFNGEGRVSWQMKAIGM